MENKNNDNMDLIISFLQEVSKVIGQRYTRDESEDENVLTDIYEAGYNFLTKPDPEDKVDRSQWEESYNKSLNLINEIYKDDKFTANFQIYPFYDESLSYSIPNFFRVYLKDAPSILVDDMISLYVSCNDSCVPELAEKIINNMDGSLSILKFDTKPNPAECENDKRWGNRKEKIVIYTKKSNLTENYKLLSELESKYPEMFSNVSRLPILEPFTKYSNIAQYRLNRDDFSPNERMAHMLADTATQVLNDSEIARDKAKKPFENVVYFDEIWKNATEEEKENFREQMRRELSSKNVYIEGISDPNRRLYRENTRGNAEQKSAINRENISENSEQRGTTADRKIPVNTVIKQIGGNTDDFDIEAMTKSLRPEPVKVYWTNADD